MDNKPLALGYPSRDEKLYELAAQLAWHEQNVATSPQPLPTLQMTPTPSYNSEYDAFSCSTSTSRQDVELEVYREIECQRQLPYPSYICHRCGRPGHLITYCPQKNLQPKSPYQGDNVSRGRFKCDCGRRWMSDHVKANTEYECRQCQAMIYPNKMWRNHAPKDTSSVHFCHTVYNQHLV